MKSNEGGPQELTAEPKEFLLNSSEGLYAELRDKNFSAVGPALSRKAKVITAQFEVTYHAIRILHRNKIYRFWALRRQERHGAKTVGEIKQFVAKLPHMQAAKQSLAKRMCQHYSIDHQPLRCLTLQETEFPAQHVHALQHIIAAME